MAETKVGPPLQVRISVALLLFSWALSATLLMYNHYFLQISGGSKLGLLLGISGLLLQAVAIHFVARGSNIARIVVVIFLLLASPGAFFVFRFIAKLSLLSASASIAGYGFKLVAAVLLFGAQSRPWFTHQPVSGGA